MTQRGSCFISAWVSLDAVHGPDYVDSVCSVFVTLISRGWKGQGNQTRKKQANFAALKFRTQFFFLIKQNLNNRSFCFTAKKTMWRICIAKMQFDINMLPGETNVLLQCCWKRF